MTFTKYRSRILVIPILLATGITATSVFSQAPNDGVSVTGKVVKFSNNKLIVKMRPGLTGAQKNAIHGKVRVDADHDVASVAGMKLIQIAAGQDLNSALALYQKNPNVEYAEPDYELSLTATNDTSYSQLWAINNSGQSVNGTIGTSDADMNIAEAWSNSGVTGSNGVVVAVIDTGVLYTHPDLAANMWTNPGEIPGNGQDDDLNGYVDDVYGINAITNSGNPLDDQGHGSHVAGTIAAVGNNSAGITGIMQNAKILACKFMSSSGGGSTSDAIKCLDYIYALKNKGINIVVSNNSWGGTGGSQALADAVDAQRKAGIIFVAAAGNDGVNNDTQPHYPSNYFVPNLISVAATTQSDGLATFSNYGKYSVHVGAPGVNIYSTVLSNGYSYYQGTSMAAPHVSGLIALLAAQDPTRNWKTIKNLVIAGGTSVTALNNKSASGRRVRAWDSNGTGAMTCTNQTVSSVLYPQASSATRIAGQKLGLAMLNINCATPAGNVSVTTTGPSTVASVTLLDDGLNFDTESGDGIYSGYWTAPATAGTYTLTFSNAQTLTVTVQANTSTLTPYRAPVAATYNLRTSASAYSALPDNYYIGISGWTAYYNVYYGGQATSTFYGTPKGTAMLSAPTSAQFTATNTALPNDIFQTLIAPYWDDLNLSAAGNGMRAWWNYNSASTPVGEIVLEWKGVQKITNVPVQFQVVFTAGSSDVLVQYAATDTSGTTATAGMQVDWVNGTTHSFDTATTDLTAGKAWLWKLDTGAPTANAGTTQNVLGNSLVTLAGSGTDNDNGVLKYRWAQTAGTTATLSNLNIANPTFYAPNTTGTLTFQLTVTDDANRTATASVNIGVTAVPSAGALQLGAASYSVLENAGFASISVSRTGGSAGAVSVLYATSDGSAAAGTHYQYASGTLNWADGDSANKTISVSITDNVLADGNKSLNVQLSNATGGASLGTTVSSVAIQDDDSPGTIALSATGYTVNETSTTVTLTATRTGGVGGTVSVDYATANGTATAVDDYTAASGTLSWTNGDATDKTFTIDIVDDALYEGSETIQVALSNATGGATLGTSSATVTIADNESAPVVNNAPGTPLLISPLDSATGVDGTAVTFKWKRVTDPDGDAVSYELYYCTDANFVGASCGPQTVAKVSTNSLIAGLGGTGMLLLGMIGYLNRRQRILLICAALTLATVNTGCGSNLPGTGSSTTTASQTVTALTPGTLYYWKVVAVDAKGATSASATWSFTTK